MIAALYVQPGGVYYGLADVDPWPEDRDARTYPGPWPVVAHPPCARWGRYWFGGPSSSVRKALGDDGGCFAAALAAIRAHGGVLEHPEASYAWPHHGLRRPPRAGGWVGGADGGWSCCVEQGHYGHAARKATWLYVHGVDPDRLPTLRWGPSAAAARLDLGYHSAEERRERARLVRAGGLRRLSARQRAATPIPFRDVLIGIARLVSR